MQLPSIIFVVVILILAQDVIRKVASYIPHELSRPLFVFGIVVIIIGLCFAKISITGMFDFVDNEKMDFSNTGTPEPEYDGNVCFSKMFNYLQIAQILLLAGIIIIRVAMVSPGMKKEDLFAKYRGGGEKNTVGTRDGLEYGSLQHGPLLMGKDEQKDSWK